VVLPRRWVVKRTQSLLMRSRCLVRDYETLPAMQTPSAGRRPELGEHPRQHLEHPPRSTRRFTFDRSPSSFAGTA